MGYPAIRSSTATSYDSDGITVTHTVQLPSDILVEDYILVLFGISNPGNIITRSLTWPLGWTVIVNDTNSDELQLGIAYKVADGTEDSTTITINSSASGYGFWSSFSIYNVAAAPSGTLGSTIDPPSHTHSYGSAGYLAFEVGIIEDPIETITGISSGYTSNGLVDQATINIITGYKTTDSATENPATIGVTGAASATRSTTIMIPGVNVASSSIFFGSNF